MSPPGFASVVYNAMVHMRDPIIASATTGSSPSRLTSPKSSGRKALARVFAAASSNCRWLIRNSVSPVKTAEAPLTLDLCASCQRSHRDRVLCDIWTLKVS